jgi:hypothetical protein
MKRLALCLVLGLVLGTISHFVVHAFGGEWGKAQSKYLSAMEADWYASLKVPGSGMMSCCGAGDAYYADDSKVGPDGQLYAIITDTRSDTITLDNGSVVTRPHISPGTEIAIPARLIRHPPIPNPTDHTVIFLNYMGSVYCYEPISGQ